MSATASVILLALGALILGWVVMDIIRHWAKAKRKGR